jgi:hypothetical protein
MHRIAPFIAGTIGMGLRLNPRLRLARGSGFSPWGTAPCSWAIWC